MKQLKVDKNIVMRGHKFHVSVMHKGHRKTGTCETLEEAKIQRTLLKAEAISDWKSGKLSPKLSSNTNINYNSWSFEDAYNEATSLPMPQGWLDTADKVTLEGRFRCANVYFLSQGLDTIDKIDGISLNGYIKYLGHKENSNATINRKISVIRKTLALAVDYGKLDALPKLPRKLKERASPERIYSGDERMEMFSNFAELVAQTENPAIKEKRAKVYDVLHILDETVARVSEVLAIDTSDLMFDQQQIRLVGSKREGLKNNTIRYVPMTSTAYEILWARSKKGTEKPFEGISRYYVYKMLKKVQRMAGFDKDEKGGVHTFRHTTASDLANSGYPIPKLQQLMGHKRIETTTRYITVDTTKDFVDKLEEVRNRTGLGTE